MCNFFSHFIFVYLSKLRLHRHFTTQKKIHIGQKKRANFGIFALDFLNFAHSFGVVLSHIAISFVKSIIYTNKTS